MKEVAKKTHGIRREFEQSLPEDSGQSPRQTGKQMKCLEETDTLVAKMALSLQKKKAVIHIHRKQREKYHNYEVR